MNEGIFFPDFWPEQNIESWKRTWIDTEFEQDVRLYHDNHHYCIGIDPLRNLYLENPKRFHRLVALFYIFGLQVHVDKGQGIFGSWKWTDNWHVITGSTAADWGLAKQKFKQERILSETPLLQECVNRQSLYGLIIEQSLQINPLVNVEQVLNILEQCNISLSTWPLNSADNDQPSLSHENSTDKNLEIAHIFDPDHEMLIIDRFSEVGVQYLSDLTQDKLNQVLNSRGVGGKRIERINTVLDEFNLLGNLANKKDSLEQNTQKILLSSRNKPLREALLELSVENMSDILPSTLLKLNKNEKLMVLLPDFIKQNRNYLAQKLPQDNIVIKMIPLAENLYRTFNPNGDLPEMISAKDYLLMLGSLQGLNSRKQQSFYNYQQLQAHISSIEQKMLLNNDNRMDFDSDQLISILHHAGIDIPNTISEKTLNYTWQFLNWLVPETINQMVEAYWLSVPDTKREIIKLRLQAEQPATLQALAAQFNLTRERVRQMEKKEIHKFLDWWQQMNMSVKLYTSLNSDVIADRLIRLETVFSSSTARLVSRIDKKLGGLVKGVSLMDKDRLFEMIINDLQPIVKGKNWLMQQHIIAGLAEKSLVLTNEELRSVMNGLNFEKINNTDIWTKASGVKSYELLELYLEQINSDIVDSSEETYERINNWTNQYFGRDIAINANGYRAMLGRETSLIPISKGQFRLFKQSNYDMNMFNDAKVLLQKKFASGYQFVRDNWLINRLDGRVPEQMINDEFYQVFHRLFPNDFEYATGRNNDFYVLGSPKLTITEQIEAVLKEKQNDVSLIELKEEYGWEEYTVLQAASADPSVVISNNEVSWIDISAAQETLSQPIIAFLQKQFTIDSVVSMNTIYAYFNEYMMSQPAEIFDETRIYTQSALTSFVKSLPMALEVIGNQFVIAEGQLPELPRKVDAIWQYYLKKIANAPKTEAQIRDLIVTVGMGFNTWEQTHEQYFNVAGIQAVSKNLYLSIDKLPRNSEIDDAVSHIVMLNETDDNFTPIQAIRSKDIQNFPEVVIEKQDGETINLFWTPELIACYATLLGYKRLQWSKNMLRTHYDVLVPNTSQYDSVQALMKVQLLKWLPYEANEINLYKRASEIYLLPKRDDISKQRFATAFYDECDLMLDEVGNVRSK
jgi:hypothetical protein